MTKLTLHDRAESLVERYVQFLRMEIVYAPAEVRFGTVGRRCLASSSILKCQKCSVVGNFDVDYCGGSVSPGNGK